MPDALNIQPGVDETAVVERVVPGRLVYVKTTNDPFKIFAFKLNELVIRKADGSCRPYRGEPLADLGLDIGRKVVVWGIMHRDVEPTLVIDVDRRKEFSVSIGNSISNAVNVTIGKILK